METKQKAIAPTLRRMGIGDTESYPIERVVSVRVTVSRLHLLQRREGKRYRVTTKGMNVFVKRLA